MKISSQEFKKCFPYDRFAWVSKNTQKTKIIRSFLSPMAGWTIRTVCSWRQKHHARNSGQLEQRSQKHGGVNRFGGSGAFDLNSQHAMSEEPDSRKDGQTDAEGAVRQSHLPSVSDLIRFTAGPVGFLDHQPISAAPLSSAQIAANAGWAVIPVSRI